jgi:predicted small integral membrane protein
VENIAWMAWTPATGAFFTGVGLVLATMIWLARTRPEVERVGVLGIPTTRGDRLFLSLGVHPPATLPIGEGIELPSLWLATVLSLVGAVVVFRTV